jgi:hypothetical protein
VNILNGKELVNLFRLCQKGKLRLAALGLGILCVLPLPSTVEAAKNADIDAATETDKKPSKEKKTAPPFDKNRTEFQFEYLDARFFQDRKVNTYNIHVFQPAHKTGALTIYRGLTFSRALGYAMPDDYDHYLDSQAVGLGPAILLRWKQKVSGKFSAAWDASGSLLFYNRCHPGGGRPWGFMWRTGPRLIWDYSDRGSVNLGWSIAHCSNGMGSKNPGYNGVGFSLGLEFHF